MGLTIHYKLKFTGTDEEARQKLERVRSIVQQLPVKEVGPLWRLDYGKDFNNAEENKRVAGSMAKEYLWAKIQYKPRGEWTEHKYLAPLAVEQTYGYVFTAWVGNGCEPTNIGLVSHNGREWSGSSFTKTQYAEHFVKAHLTVIAILDICDKVGILKEVSDEGGYWESRNMRVLGGNINAYTGIMSSIAKILHAIVPEGEVISGIDGCKNYVNVRKAEERR
ncbi:MAG: hypothetical protein KKB59_18845 [Spirochaetes bacterium]|nr:hypothetical protein [Spirochaetota bacterium]